MLITHMQNLIRAYFFLNQMRAASESERGRERRKMSERVAMNGLYLRS